LIPPGEIDAILLVVTPGLAGEMDVALRVVTPGLAGEMDVALRVVTPRLAGERDAILLVVTPLQNTSWIHLQSISHQLGHGREGLERRRSSL